jgi:hypothetical protein
MRGWRRLLLGAFIVYMYGWLGYVGASHRHETEASHQDCQLCHLSSQPSLAHAPAIPPEPLVLPAVFQPREASAVLAPRHSAFLSRGPPSV